MVCLAMCLMVNLTCSKADAKSGLQASEKDSGTKEEPGADPTTINFKDVAICK